MELAATFILSLLGGYLFASSCRLTAFSTHRSEGHHLHFRAALWGVVYFAVAFVLRMVALDRWPWYATLDNVVVQYILPALKQPSDPRQVELVITAAYSLILGPAFGGLFNLVTPKDWSLRRALSGMDSILYGAQQNDMPVCVTLDSGKVYVGLVKRITDPDRSPPSITLFPMFSGRRDAQGRLELTTDYEKVYRTLESDKEKPKQYKLPNPWEQVFLVVIRVASIISVTMFSPKILEEFNPDWRKSLKKNKKALLR